MKLNDELVQIINEATAKMFKVDLHLEDGGSYLKIYRDDYGYYIIITDKEQRIYSTKVDMFVKRVVCTNRRTALNKFYRMTESE